MSVAPRRHGPNAPLVPPCMAWPSPDAAVPLAVAVELFEHVNAVEFFEHVNAVELVKLFENVNAVELVKLVNAVKLVGRRKPRPCARAGGCCRRARGPLVRKKVEAYGYAERLRVNAEATKREALKARERIATVKKLRAMTAKERAQMVREWRIRAREGIKRARKSLQDLRAGLRAASKATREIAGYIAPGARVVLSAQERAAIDTLARRHAEQIASAEKRAEGAAALIEAHAENTIEARRLRARLREERGRLSAGGRRPSRSAEAAAEVESEVMNDLASPEEVVLYQHAKRSGGLAAVQRKDRAGRMTPTEQFYQWVHDHAGEVPRILADYYEADAERAWSEMEAREEETRAAPDDGIPF